MELLSEDIQDRYKSCLNYKLQCRGIRIVAEVDYPRGSCEHFIILNSFMPLCLYILKCLEYVLHNSDDFSHRD
jgi:hypothetical protein